MKNQLKLLMRVYQLSREAEVKNRDASKIEKFTHISMGKCLLYNDVLRDLQAILDETPR